MERKDFIKITGLTGAASFISFNPFKAKGNTPAACVLIPSETAGPFPLDLTTNNFYFRQDVRETRTGVQLNMKMRIIGLSNCLPMQNVRVNIWHCDKDGLYSGYQTETGLTYLRGYQITDVNGEVEFITIFPGWYTGRICHIHFQVYVSSVYAAVSQLTFPLAEKNNIYAANASVYTKGLDPLNFSQDGVFADGYTYQLATLTPNTSTGGYDSFLELAVQGSGTATGLGALEPETGGQFKLGQNFPNPYTGETAIPFTLKNESDVKLELWDLNGRKVASLTKRGMKSGEQQILISPEKLGIAVSNYAYQLEVVNSNGVFRQSKLMSAGK